VISKNKFIGLIIALLCTQISLGQSLSHKAGVGVLGTRQSLVNYLDYGLQFKKYRAELAFGYELGRAAQYQHFAPAFGFGLGFELMNQEKLHLDLKSNFLCLRNQYPSNSSIVSRSFYMGYELRIGEKIQLSQRLSLGLLHNEALSGYNKLIHDFLFSCGVHYCF
jgi:hypothetical protein